MKSDEHLLFENAPAPDGIERSVVVGDALVDALVRSVVVVVREIPLSSRSN